MRKVIQIASAGTCMWILCDDGTMWNNFKAPQPGESQWKQVPGVPQGCDGSGPHDPTSSLRLMPTGGGGNSIFCFSCWQRELKYRMQRNEALAKGNQFDLPTFAQAKVYKG